jgi:hypothetical protein
MGVKMVSKKLTALKKVDTEGKKGPNTVASMHMLLLIV